MRKWITVIGIVVLMGVFFWGKAECPLIKNKHVCSGCSWTYEYPMGAELSDFPLSKEIWIRRYGGFWEKISIDWKCDPKFRRYVPGEYCFYSILPAGDDGAYEYVPHHIHIVVK